MRYLQLFSLCAGLSLGLTGVAQAQPQPGKDATPSGVTVTIGKDVISKDELWYYVNAAHCEDPNTKILIKIEAAWNPNPEAMEVWVGPSDTDCSKGTNRDLPNSSGKAPCRNVEIENDVKPGPTPTIELTTRELFGTDGEIEADNDGGVDVSLRCDNGEKWVYVLALKTPSQDNNNVDVETDDTRYVGFYVDDILPDEPTEVSTGSGESQVTVSWTLPQEVTGNSDFSVRIYYDAAAIASTIETCKSTQLVAGAAPGDAKGMLTYDKASGTKYSAAPSALGLTKLNTQVPIAVAAVDPAGNVGVFSEVKCVAKVQTLGFDEVCNADPECKSGFDTCSTTPWRTGGLAGALALVSCAVVFARRRRRNV